MRIAVRRNEVLAVSEHFIPVRIESGIFHFLIIAQTLCRCLCFAVGRSLTTATTSGAAGAGAASDLSDKIAGCCTSGTRRSDE
jgi:hypothetical protein